ncbi:MAG: STAS domain-containing protein [Planctomycetota bacterium]
MELRVLSDDGDVLRLELAERVLRSDRSPDLTPFDDLLGPGGYARRVSLSLAETRFIDTRSLAWLLALHKRFSEAGGRLVMHSIRPQLMEMLTMLRFVEILSIAEDEAGALELLRQG